MNPERSLKVARLGRVDYEAALKLQEAMVGARLQDRLGDTLLLLEHPHVYTLGRGADERFILDVAPDIPVHRVSRGGEVTYHGPGQLVGYPVLRLSGADRDVHRYLRRLEEVLIRALADAGIAATRRAGLTGVWVGKRKIGSLGVGLRRWVTRHGFALNVTTDLRFFGAIVPCGIENCEMTSVAALGGKPASVEAMCRPVARRFAEVFGFGRPAEVAPEAVLATLGGAAEPGAALS